MFTHKTGCPAFSLTSFVSFLQSHPWIIAVVLIVFGLVVTFAGALFFKYTIAVAAGIVAWLTLMLFFSVIGWLQALDGDDKGNVALTVISFLVATALSVFAGWFLFKLERIGATLLAGAVGFFVGTTIYNLFFFWANNVYVLIVFDIVFVVLFAFLAYRFFDHILVFGTAFLGAYALVRGISLFAGHFPNEIEIFQQLSNGIKPELDGYFYIYLGAIVVTFIIGVVVQKRVTFKNTDEGYNKIN